MAYDTAIRSGIAATGMTLLLISNTYAALVEEDFGDFVVQYDDEVMTLFDRPMVGGNTIFFLPSSFEVSLPADASEDATREALTSDTVSFAVIPRSLNLLTGLDLVEQGDFTHLGDGPPDAYIVNGRVFVRDAGNPVDFISTPFEHTFTSGDNVVLGTWELQQPLDTGRFVEGAWITIENFLRVVDTGSGFSPIPSLPPPGGFGSEMFLQKKFIGVTVGVSPVPIGIPGVPVPAAVWLLGSALATLSIFARRARFVGGRST